MHALLLATLLAATPDDPAGRAMVQEAQRTVAAWHANQPPSTDVLRVVYFVPRDREPLAGYADRLDRAVNDISNFYRDGLARFGVTIPGLPLEKKDGKLVFHLVHGKLPATDYHYDSGNRTASEIHAALKGEINVSREHVLVFYALCRREADGRYVFDAPYYGGGSQSAGLCHAADCELLDPQLLSETKKKIVYTEHYYPRVEESISRFNTKYLGGAAHELGHALGLVHDSGSADEASFGVSLMGAGNLSYRQELWSKSKPAFLTRATTLQLISHPLVTGSNRGRWDPVKGGLRDLEFTVVNRVLRMKGAVDGVIPAYAVVALVWPRNAKSDHLARSFPVLLKDGAFTLDLDGLRPDNWSLKLMTLHVNGATTHRDFQFGFDAAGLPVPPSNSR